jgi:hypothetical protein
VVAGVRIEAGGELAFDPAASHTLTSTGNVIVHGALRTRPQGHEVEHVVRFDGIDESRFQGGHAVEPVDTDVGLWVVGSGVLDVQGTAKRAWTNLTGSADAGAASIEVVDASGWQVGDEVVVTPTDASTVDGFAEHHDRRTVTRVDGSTVELDEPLEHAHPAVTVRPGTTHHAEVLNLTRNVRVEGTPDGRAHVAMVGLDGPQQIGYVALRHLGPQETDPERGVQGVVGRYSLHFHTSFDATQGTVVEGAVAYDGGNHAFVPHLSHGITLRDCIAHDQDDSAYWWDPAHESDDEENEVALTNDLVFERCVASFIRPAEAHPYELAGFVLASGRGNVARACVATGVLGDDSSTPGFGWRGDGHEHHPWVFEDCLAHDNTGSSLYFWVNGVPPSFVDRFTSYHDGQGILAGAYTNLVSYRDCTVYACGAVGLTVEAVPTLGDEPPPDLTVTYENVYVDQAGLSEFAVHVSQHVIEPDTTTRLSGCHFTGGTTAQVGFPEPGPYAQLYEFTDCTFDGNAFWMADDLTDVVDVVVRDDVHGAVTLRPAGQEGQVRPEWNASVASA